MKIKRKQKNKEYGEHKKRRKDRTNGGKRIVKRIGQEILELLYPRRCPICQCILSRGEGLVCSACRPGLPYIRGPVCMKCGKPVKTPEQEYCPDCERTHHRFVCGRAIFLYEKAFRRSVHRMKFENRREYLDFYGEEMARVGGAWLKQWRPGIILPVPMNERKRRERGFDQSRLLARKIGEFTGIPVDTKSLIRSRYTRPQKELDAKARKENLQGAFSFRPQGDIREPVLLIDDIYTTGATMDAVCNALENYGIHRIYFLVLCTGKGK